MKPRIRYLAKLTKDRITANRPPSDVLRESLATWPEGTDLSVTIQERQHDKTNPQLGFYHAGIVPALWLIFSEMGYRLTESQASEAYQQHVCTANKETFEKPGGLTEIRVRLSAMTKEQMMIFIDEALQFCAENGQVVDATDYGGHTS